MPYPTAVTPASPASSNGRAIAFMVGAMACFICNDTIIKYLGESLPVGQLTMLRSVMVVALLMALPLTPLWQGPREAMPWRLLGHRWVVLRALCDATGTLLYLSALVHLPIANATAIGASLPLMLVALAALLLGERVGPVRALLAASGFVGVLLVVQPRLGGFGGWALVCLTGVVFHALRDFFTRHVPPQIPSRVISVASALAIGVVGTALSLQHGWLPLSPPQWLLLLLAALFLCGAYQCIITSLRTGELSAAAPFRYSSLIFALVLGYTIWGHVPNTLAWAGIALILASGLLMLRAQRVSL